MSERRPAARWRRRARARGRALFASTALVAVLLASLPARADYQCDGEYDDCQCAADNPYPCCDNGGGNFGNCTWWGWDQACCNWAYGLPGWGHAKSWAGEAALHADFDVLSSPVPGSIGCRDIGTYGHVAWVTAVNGSTITVTEMNCCDGCNNGARTHTYQADYFTGGYIVLANQCECSPGVSQDDSCGDCGQHTRTCAGDCTWNDWSACDGPDPGGGTEPCDTGQLGACAEGFARCVDGNLECEAATVEQTEVCNSIDDDCDGQTDEDGVCGDGGVGGGGVGGSSLPPAGGGGYGAGWGTGGTAGAGGASGIAASPGIVGECSCRQGRAAEPSALQLCGMVIFALGLGRRRRQSAR